MSKNQNVLLRPSQTIRLKWPANFIEADLLEFRDQQIYTTYDSYLKYYRDVWLSPDSVIYKNGLLIKESLPSKQYENYYKVKHLIKKVIKGKKYRLDVNTKYLLVTDLWSEGHFHWFGDILPKLLCIADSVSDFVLLLQDTPYIRTIAIQSLERMNLNFKDIVFLNKDGLYKVKNLYSISKLGESGHFQPELMYKLREQLKIPESTPTKRLYISRKQAQYRKVLNESILEKLLNEYGFETLNPENLNLSEQVAVFSSAHTLISIHGAGLTNCLFMKEGSKVIEIRKKENGANNVGYWHLAESLGHEFYYYDAVPDSDLPLVGRGCNLTVPVEDFETSILRKL